MFCFYVPHPISFSSHNPIIVFERRIAKVVSQVHAFQEVIFTYGPDRDLQTYLRHRITKLGNSDILLQTAADDADSQQSTERQTRRVQATLKKVKASLQ